MSRPITMSVPAVYPGFSFNGGLETAPPVIQMERRPVRASHRDADLYDVHARRALVQQPGYDWESGVEAEAMQFAENCSKLETAGVCAAIMVPFTAMGYLGAGAKMAVGCLTKCSVSTNKRTDIRDNLMESLIETSVGAGADYFGLPTFVGNGLAAVVSGSAKTAVDGNADFSSEVKVNLAEAAVDTTFTAFSDAASSGTWF
ncbi:MAG: hypothetical protein ACI9BD_001370 [Candidatus Marinamargulisbacteria bacterium]|jgi:hypothetical protein